MSNIFLICSDMYMYVYGFMSNIFLICSDMYMYVYGFMSNIFLICSDMSICLHFNGVSLYLFGFSCVSNITMFFCRKLWCRLITTKFFLQEI